jgi:hypothetical protein
MLLYYGYKPVIERYSTSNRMESVKPRIKRHLWMFLCTYKHLIYYAAPIIMWILQFLPGLEVMWCFKGSRCTLTFILIPQGFMCSFNSRRIIFTCMLAAEQMLERHANKGQTSCMSSRLRISHSESQGFYVSQNCNVSAAGFVSIFRWGEGKTYCVGSLDTAKLNRWTSRYNLQLTRNYDRNFVFWT